MFQCLSALQHYQTHFIFWRVNKLFVILMPGSLACHYLRLNISKIQRKLELNVHIYFVDAVLTLLLIYLYLTVCCWQAFHPITLV